MRAQVFYGPGDLRFEDIPVPEPEPGGLVVRVEAALTCGTDVKTLRRGHPVMIPHVPTVFGHELAGVVTAVGRGAPGVKEGDRILFGKYSGSEITLDGDEHLIIREDDVLGVLE